MIPDHLDENAIKKSVFTLNTLNYSKATISEIEELLKPLFSGYKLQAPAYDPGIYLYRARIFNKNKPSSLSELSYPPQQYVKEYGRANDINESMFYGSITKNIPLFEIGASIDDKLGISMWKTTAPLWLNHVGFTDEVFSLLGSISNRTKVYQFISATKNFSDLNKFIYNYLAAAFSKIIPQHHNYRYKLSIAITKKLLMGNAFHGVLYPSIAMKGNSDNIVIKPSFVDDFMQFVAVEYVKVIDDRSGSFEFDVLDTATEIVDGKLMWSGKYLGANLDSKELLSFNSDGSDWMIKNQTQQRIDPVPITPILVNASAVEKRYVKSFQSAYKVSSVTLIKGINDATSIECKWSLILDFKHLTRTIAFYIPQVINSEKLVSFLIANLDNYLFVDIKEDMLMGVGDESDINFVSSKVLEFSNEVYIFSENQINESSVVNTANLKISYDY